MSSAIRHAKPRSSVIRVLKPLAGAVVGLALAAGVVIGGRAVLDRLRDDELVAVEESSFDVATVDVRDLTETYEATGTLQFDEPIEIASPIGGTLLAVVEVGDRLVNGDVIAVVDDRAVVWLDGEVPAWRALGEGDEGVDVLQLESALTALGFNDDGDVTVDEEYTSATAAMVEAWQASLGVAETGRIESGTVVFGGDRDRVAATSVAVGDAIESGSPVVSIGARSRFAVLEATPSEAVTLAIGDEVSVDLPDRTELPGTVANVRSGSDVWTITVEFGDDVEFPATDVTNVEMTWTHVVEADVLTVPGAALLRLDDGSYTVEVIGADGTTIRTPVTVGQAVGTRVEITSGLTAGLDVLTL